MHTWAPNRPGAVATSTIAMGMKRMMKRRTTTSSGSSSDSGVQLRRTLQPVESLDGVLY